jgi:hypothetical protein
MSADINLDNIHANVDLDGSLLNNVRVNLNGNLLNDIGVDAGLDNVQVKVNGPVSVEATIKDVIRTDSKLDARTDSKLAAHTDSKLEARTDSKVDLGLDDIRITELPPLKLEFAWRPFRFHLPVNLKFCIELLGVPLFKFSLCGETMAIGEDYQPRATEKCG